MFSMELTPIAERFILHWGEMGTKWGVNRTVAQIHALLFFYGRPMHAEEITETLSVARSNVSNCLKELQNWNLIHVVHIIGDRRDYFNTSTDVWELMRTVVHERKVREFNPVIQALQDCLEDPTAQQEDPAAMERIRETLLLMKTTSTWAEEMIKLKPETLAKVMRLGAKIQNLLHGDNWYLNQWHNIKPKFWLGFGLLPNLTPAFRRGLLLSRVVQKTRHSKWKCYIC